MEARSHQGSIQTGTGTCEGFWIPMSQVCGALNHNDLFSLSGTKKTYRKIGCEFGKSLGHPLPKFKIGF